MSELPGEFGRLSIARLKVEAGDAVVIKSSVPISATVAERIKDHVEKLVPAGVKVMVIDRDLSVSVIEKVA